LDPDPVNMLPQHCFLNFPIFCREQMTWLLFREERHRWRLIFT
jgi:hypothetical protein